MKIILAIGAGSFIGGVLRYLLTLSVQGKLNSTFPFGTLAVNILGCFLIGLVFSLSERGNFTQEWRLFMVTGVLGGFTTFSAFSNESISLLRNGQFVHAATYILLSVGLGLLATFIGASLLKLF